MTGEGAGMTGESAGMTREGAGMTRESVGMTETGGNDGDGCRLRGDGHPRRRQSSVQSLQTSQTQFLQAKLRVMVGRPMMSS